MRRSLPVCRSRGVTVLLISLLMLWPGLTAMASTAIASPTTAAAWIGSPLQATWPNTDGCDGAGGQYPSDTCSLPSAHHIVYLQAAGETGDWAADLQNVSPGTAVVLFAAPQDTGMSITAKVESVGPACSSRNLADGGSVVVVGLYNGGTKIGAAAYAHIEPSVGVGEVSRWGTKLGTVGSYTSGSCWSAPHVHVELISEHNYACYNKGWHPGQAMGVHDFIGFVGGNYASGPRRTCP